LQLLYAIPNEECLCYQSSHATKIEIHTDSEAMYVSIANKCLCMVFIIFIIERKIEQQNRTKVNHNVAAVAGKKNTS